MEHPAKHILLSSMGAGTPRETLYAHGDRSHCSHFSAFGLWQLLPEEDRPDEIWFLLTPKAKEVAWPAIKQEAKDLDITITEILLQDDVPDDTHAFLETVAERIPDDGCQLTLDVTQGLRHHAFLFYALALYLSEFRNVTIQGAWYNRWEIESEVKPFIDLKPTLDLAHWFHALAVFRETGSLREVSQQMAQGEQRKQIEQLSSLFVNGMPLETGNEAARIIDVASPQSLVSGVPLGDQLQELILDDIRLLSGSTFETHPKKDEPERGKKAVPLTNDELKRQATYIDRYFQTGQLNLAFGLMREWIVNWIVIQRNQTDDWLDRWTREEIEHNLGGLAEVLKAKDTKDPKGKRYKHAAVREQLTESQREWAKRWSRVCDIRNALQHHGMKAAVFEPHRRDIRQATDDWNCWPDWESPPEFGGGEGKLLICPIGLTPGVLYSALKNTSPDRAIIICSEQSKSSINEAIAHAGIQAETKTLSLQDTYTGIDEFAGLIDKASLWLFEADQILANLTGGTTLMGVLVSQLTKRAAREYQRPVREFVLIDKRPPEEQRNDPWKLGEIHYLDGGPRSDKSDKQSDHYAFEERT